MAKSPSSPARAVVWAAKMPWSFASRGASLVVNYAKSAYAAENVVAGIEALGTKAIAIQADVSKPAEIVALFDKAVKHYGHLDIVVSNSGVESFGHIAEITPEEFDRVFTVNTRGHLLVAQQAYKHLTEGGRLVMLSSISASAKGMKDHGIYSGSKNAVEAFARCLAVDLGDKRITVNAIAPGGIRTDIWIEAARKYIPGPENWSDEQVDEAASTWSPLKRPGYPEDIARVVAFLCSNDGEWVNGQVLQLGGGAAILIPDSPWAFNTHQNQFYTIQKADTDQVCQDDRADSYYLGCGTAIVALASKWDAGPGDRPVVGIDDSHGMLQSARGLWQYQEQNRGRPNVISVPRTIQLYHGDIKNLDAIEGLSEALGLQLRFDYVFVRNVIDASASKEWLPALKHWANYKTPAKGKIVMTFGITHIARYFIVDRYGQITRRSYVMTEAEWVQGKAKFLDFVTRAGLLLQEMQRVGFQDSNGPPWKEQGPTTRIMLVRMYVAFKTKIRSDMYEECLEIQEMKNEGRSDKDRMSIHPFGAVFAGVISSQDSQ
ncbi:MAG: hypothetical protein Q9218_004636 [Villophora microphyllina]